MGCGKSKPKADKKIQKKPGKQTAPTNDVQSGSLLDVENHQEIVQELDNHENDDDVNNQDEYGWTQLHYAVFKGTQECCMRFISLCSKNCQDYDPLTVVKIVFCLINI